MIIGIAGKSDVGKDIVARIIQELKMGHSTSEIEANMKNLNTAKYDTIRREDSSFEVKRFSDKLKDIVCILLSCTREQLEDEEFLNKDLGEEWWIWKHEESGTILPYNSSTGAENYTFIKQTPRILLELLRTECGEQIVHPNIWVNALFMDYKSTNVVNVLCRQRATLVSNITKMGWVVPEGHGEHSGKVIPRMYMQYYSKEPVYPNWIITDVEFPNQVQAIKDRNGVVIQVDNSSENIEELIEKVRTILIDLKIIK